MPTVSAAPRSHIRRKSRSAAPWSQRLAWTWPGALGGRLASAIAWRAASYMAASGSRPLLHHSSIWLCSFFAPLQPLAPDALPAAPPPPSPPCSTASASLKTPAMTPLGTARQQPLQRLLCAHCAGGCSETELPRDRPSRARRSSPTTPVPAWRPASACQPARRSQCAGQQVMLGLDDMATIGNFIPPASGHRRQHCRQWPPRGRRPAARPVCRKGRREDTGGACVKGKRSC
mmetsp:Transcript_99319/g.289835  ORF Transcript_99319/g.289835 Transcript_99319/m.289835 type:complete len:232 (-) Transcript_99319:11-706(-)